MAPITETVDPDMLTRAVIAIRMYGYIQFLSFETVGMLRGLHYKHVPIPRLVENCVMHYNEKNFFDLTGGHSGMSPGGHSGMSPPLATRLDATINKGESM